MDQIVAHQAQPEMPEKTFKDYQALIYKVAGIALADSKKALLMNRIAKRMRALGISSAEAYLTYVQSGSKEEVEKLIDVVSTNVTHFFREEPHFNFLSNLCHGWKAERKRSIKIWCAAASSGQEPYTIAMTLCENLNLPEMDIKILGTDICSDVLIKAVEGHYKEQDTENIPKEILDKYFEVNDSDDGPIYTTRPILKNLITFKRLNLAEFPYPLKGNFDVIFCRNVMIYFDRPMRQKVIDQFYNLLSPGGHLILSHSENVLGIEHQLKSLGSSIFRK